MAKIALFLNIDELSIVAALHEAGGKLDGGEGEMVIDFSSVRRIDSSALQAVEELAHVAGGKAVKVILRGVNVDVYKALKLVRLTERFLFVS